jgi:hypothetical protein
MGASPTKALAPNNSREEPMGSNSTQAVAILIMLIGFTLLAGSLAGGGIVLGIGALALLAIAAFFFMKVKGLEHQE